MKDLIYFELYRNRWLTVLGFLALFIAVAINMDASNEVVDSKISIPERLGSWGDGDKNLRIEDLMPFRG